MPKLTCTLPGEWPARNAAYSQWHESSRPNSKPNTESQSPPSIRMHQLCKKQNYRYKIPIFSTIINTTYRPVFSVLVGPGLSFCPGWAFPPAVVPELELVPALFVCRFSLYRRKNESPPEDSCRTGSSAEPAGAIMSGMPGMSSRKSSSAPKLIVLRFFLSRCEGGPYLVVISKSPYIRRISALFSSMNDSMRSLWMEAVVNKHIMRITSNALQWPLNSTDCVF